MSLLADLHIHTYFSDGTRSPEEVVQFAKEKNISVISVCDHCTTEAYGRLEKACAQNNIKLIHGVEIDVIWEDMYLHILGYGFDRNNSDIKKLLESIKEELVKFDDDFISNAAKDYPQLSLNEYHDYSYPPELGGWKDTNYLVNKNVVKTPAEGVELFKTYSKYEIQYPCIGRACEAIKKAGGIPVLAHPGNWWEVIPDNFTEILAGIKDSGIEGIECYYPSHSEALTKACVDFCKDNEMYITCGSDDHGEFNRIVNGVEYRMGVINKNIDIDKLYLGGLLK